MARSRWLRLSTVTAFASLSLGVACGGPAEEPAAEVEANRGIGIDNPVGHFDGDFDAAGQEGEDDRKYPEPVAPEIYDHVKVFDPRIAQFFGVSDGRLVIPVRGHEDLAAVQPGHVLVSAYLFMRKVVVAGRIGDNWVFDTVDAQLTDAVRRGDFNLRVVGYTNPETKERTFYDPDDDVFSPTYDPDAAAARDDVYGRGGLAAIAQGVEGMEQGVGLTGKLGDGRYGSLGYSGKLSWKPNLDLSFVPQVVVRGAIRDPPGWFNSYVQSFEFSASGTFTLTLGVEFKAQGAVNGTLEYKFLTQAPEVGKPAPLFLVPCVTASGAIGIVPIWADLCPSVTAKAEATVTGELVVTASVSFSKTVGGGFRYNHDNYPQWTKWVNNPPLTVTPTVTKTTSVAIKGGVALEPKLAINLYSIAGPFIGFSTGLELESKCTAPELKTELSWVNELSGGVAVTAPGWARSVVGDSLDEISYSAKLWSPAPVKIWGRTDVCDPGQAYLTYQSVRAAPLNATNLQTLDLDLNMDVPGPAGVKTMSRDNQLPNRIAPAYDVFPFADYLGMQCSGCAETIVMKTAQTTGTYKVWVSDYDNDLAAEANDAMSRARAQVRIVNGQTAYGPYSAPGGNYNRWNVATFTANAAGTFSVTRLNTTGTSNLHGP